MKIRFFLLGACLALVLMPCAAGTKEELARLDQQLSALQDRMAKTEGSLAAIQKSLSDLSAKIDAVGRSAQTADIRADMDQLKRQVEALSSQVASLRGEQPRAYAPAPPTLPAIESPPNTAFEPAPPAAAREPAPPRAGVTSETYGQAYSDYVQGKYDLAASEFKQFLDAFPADPRAGNSQYWIGECHYSQKRYLEAQEAFQDVIEHFPGSGKVLAARLKLGLTFMALGDPQRGAAELKALIQAAPNSDEALIAKDRLSRLQSP